MDGIIRGSEKSIPPASDNPQRNNDSGNATATVARCGVAADNPPYGAASQDNSGLISFAALIEQAVTLESEEALFRSLNDYVRQTLRADRASINLFDYDNSRIETVAIGDDQLGQHLWHSTDTNPDVFARHIERHRAASVRKIADNLHLEPYPKLMAMGLVYCMHAPLRSGAVVLGSVNVGFRDADASKCDVGLLEQLASVVSVILLRSRELQQTIEERNRHQLYARHLELLSGVAENLSAVTNLQHALQQVATTAKELTGAERVSICSLSNDGSHIIIKGLVGNSSDRIGGAVNLQESGLEDVFKSGVLQRRPLSANSPHASSRRLFESGYAYVWSLPVTSQGKVKSVLNISTRERRVNVQDVSAVLDTLSRILGSTIERLEAQQVLEQKHSEVQLLARTDALTGLANKRYFEVTIESLIAKAEQPADQLRTVAENPGNQAANGAGFGLIYFDLDCFKDINDTLGHHVGDQILCCIAARIQTIIGPNDLAARVGGDEFFILLRDYGDYAELRALASRLVEQFVEPVKLEEVELRLSLSIGLCEYPQHGETAVDLIKNADIAMYEAKRAGRDCVIEFDSTLADAVRNAVELEADLDGAIERGELEVVYQPQWCCIQGRFAGVEALLRWHHPQRGLVRPDVFIPIAEKSGVITDITAWVLADSLQSMAALLRQRPDLVLAVNVSALDFSATSTLVDTIQGLLHKHDLPSYCLEIELTETALLGNPEQARRIIDELRALGVRIALDDFGTGYASLAYLVDFPMDKIKIDRSFINGLLGDNRKQAVVLGLSRMATSLGTAMLAEGVETQAQRDWLQQHDCTSLQGYLFSKPVGFVEAIALLEAAPIEASHTDPSTTAEPDPYHPPDGHLAA